MCQDSIPAVRYATIPRFPGYEFGDDGSAWSYWNPCGKGSDISSSRHRLKPSPAGRCGHLQVRLANHGQEYLHRLILEAFVGPCPEGMEACHDPDDDPANCCLNNIRWGTRRENLLDRNKHGKHRKQARITDDQVRFIRSSSLSGNALAEMFGVWNSQISRIRARQRCNSVPDSPDAQ